MDNQFTPIEPKKDTAITTKRQIERAAVSKAIYMVTDLFEEGEPLKSTLRKAALDILTSKEVRHTDALSTLVGLAREIDLITEVNATILLRAIRSIGEEVRGGQREVQIEETLKFKDQQNALSRTVDSAPSKEIVAEVGRVDSVVEKPKEAVEPKRTERPTIASSVTTTLDIGTRRKKILEVVKSKGQATIHEFIQSIQGCSSKTIQRELTSLVLSGTLKKTGERRWSKYSLR
ncbi:MAG: hypothetical protein V4686_02660 [Patescibacteria group bacterium]